jgi:hypothetical protein
MLDHDTPCRYCTRHAERSVEREYWPLKLPCVVHDDCRLSPKLGDECAKSTYQPRRFRRWVCGNEHCFEHGKRECDEWHARVMQEDADRLGRVRSV